MVRVTTLELRDAEAYLDDYLSQGRSLSAVLRGVMRDTKGSLSAILPNVAFPECLLKFETGILCTPNPVHSFVRQWLATVVGQHENCIGLFESAYFCRSDEGLAKRTWAADVYAFLDEEVYSIVQHCDVNADQVDRAIRAVTSHLLVGVIAVDSKLAARAERPLLLSPSDIESSAHEARAVLFEAYDGDGYLIWIRGDAPPTFELPTRDAGA